MEITEVRITRAGDIRGGNDRLAAFCSVTLDDMFAVRDMKIIRDRHGLFVAMPSRKVHDSCPECGGKTPVTARFCGDCGTKLCKGREAAAMNEHGRLHVDVAFPVNAACREMFEATILAAYEAEERGLGEIRTGRLPAISDRLPVRGKAVRA